MSGLKVELLHYVEDAIFEKRMHKKLSSYNRVGEWFDCPAEVAIETLNKLKSEYEAELKENLERIKGIDLNSADPSVLVGLPRRYLTKYDMDKVRKYMIDKLIEKSGGDTELAKMLGKAITTVRGWKERGRISKEGALTVEDHPILGEKFKACDLRPDLEIDL